MAIPMSEAILKAKRLQGFFRRRTKRGVAVTLQLKDDLETILSVNSSEELRVGKFTVRLNSGRSVPKRFRLGRGRWAGLPVGYSYNQNDLEI